MYIELAFITLAFCQPFLIYAAYKTGRNEKIPFKNPLIPFFDTVDTCDENGKSESDIWENVFNYDGSPQGQKEVK
ncbi:MAG: hypothetical protein RRY40_02070 [Oscillospiraceae bacterium]